MSFPAAINPANRSQVDVKMQHSLLPLGASANSGSSSESNSYAKKVTKISSAVISNLFDFTILLPCAAGLIAQAVCTKSFDPKVVKQDKAPILLIHGSGFNQSEWIIGRRFLNKPEYGSVFSLNYDGLVSNKPDKGIDDYARDQITEKINLIKKLTNQNEVILIGHSMGGLIASRYAQAHAKDNGVQVKHIITIATPWKGAPLLLHCNPQTMDKRYSQMREGNEFLLKLGEEALKAERDGTCNTYNIDGETDFMVPSPNGLITQNPDRVRTYRHLSHYGLVVAPSVWTKINGWLDNIYTPKMENPKILEGRIRKVIITEGISMILTLAAVAFGIYRGI